jgi:predicted GIY-YIG superfamily endonuclease
MLQSSSFPERYYVGCTSDLKRRLAEHNSGKEIHTGKFVPWTLVGY